MLSLPYLVVPTFAYYIVGVDLHYWISRLVVLGNWCIVIFFCDGNKTRGHIEIFYYAIMLPTGQLLFYNGINDNFL